MSHDPRPPVNPSSGDPAGDKFEQHHRQQLSALIDGELSPDEARFLLRRLEHDGELADRLERWQLSGDVLRGQVRRAVDPGFGARVAAAIAAAPAHELQPKVANGGRGGSWMRWGGGGAALAASVAVVAMLVGRQDVDVPGPAAAAALAQQQTLPATEAVLAAAPAVEASSPITTAPVAPQPARAQRQPPREVAVAAATRAVRAPVRRAAAQPSPDMMAGLAPAPATALADAGDVALPAAADPFASSAPLQARPWPRAALPQGAGNGYVASFGGAPGQDPAPAFYPFEPRLPAQATAPDGNRLPALPDGD